MIREAFGLTAKVTRTGDRTGGSSYSDTKLRQWRDPIGAPEAFFQGGHACLVQVNLPFPIVSKANPQSHDGRYCEHLIKGETHIELQQSPAQAEVEYSRLEPWCL